MKRRAKPVPRKRPRPTRPASYDVVALVGSAGSHTAIETLLRALPEGFSVPIVVMRHIAPSVPEPLRPAYGYRTPLAAEWARTGAVLAPGSVLVAPPSSFLEIMPDSTCVLSPCERGALDKPIDRLLQSLARSFAHRAIGVVLSGMLNDGAEGARELRSAGGTVIVQSGAEYSSMPHAALRSGGADVTLPLEQIADLLAKLAAGATIPRPLSEREAVHALFAGDDPAQAAMRAVRWAATPLGPVLEWPQALSIAVRNAMSSTFPTCIYWGPELVQIHNEAFLPILGAKPLAAGKPARLTWPEIWSALGPRLESVLRTGKAVFAEDQLFQPDRHGYAEELYLTYSYSALHDTDGTVRGVLSTSTETTERVRASRRLRVLRNLAAIERGQSPLLVAENAAKVLADAPLDVPFALFYLLKGRTRASLAACVGLDAGTPGALHAMELSDQQAVWPLAQVAQTASPCTVNDLASRLPGVHSGPWPEPPSSATLLPLWSGTDGPISGVVVLGKSPRLRVDPMYEDFLRLIAQHVSTAIGDAEARAHERERADRLAEIDRAKVDFFSNVSHEFRTPLTLMLGPVEEMLARRQSLPADLGSALEAAARNGQRLLMLVNTLLDFSKTESHREQARLALTDLAALTIDVANAFRSAIEAAGLQLDVRCDPRAPQVWVDPQMWERIVSNLLSNALKFTFEGEITVTLEALSLHAQLVVADTGIGIPDDEIPNLFKRFHRVRGARARSAEGTGIGLSIVQDLVKRMRGQLVVRSKENAGTAFTIWLPYKPVREIVEHSQADPEFRPTELAAELAREASRWTADSDPAGGARGVLDDVFGPPQRLASSPGRKAPGRILVVDDNADMREHLERLLSPRWRVEKASDGASAFEAAVAIRPDVVLADVMMPGLDGFELLKRIRAHPEMRHTPYVLLTARAGEHAAIEGLLAGADDYIAKPFSPRELVARIAAALERARAEAVLREHAVWLSGQREALEAAVNGAPLETSLGALVRTATEALGQGTRAAFYLANDDGTTLHHVVGMPAAYAEQVDGFQIGPESLACGLATHTGEPVITTDVQEDPRWERWRWMAERFDYRGCWSFPIHTTAGKFVGTLAVYWREPRAATERDRQLASLLTDTASIVISRHAESEVRKRAEEALRESEEKYRTLFDSIDEGFCIIEVLFDRQGKAKGHRFLAMNPTFFEQTGLAQASSKTMLELVPQHERPWFETYGEIARTGEARRFEHPAQAFNRWYDVYAFRIGTPEQRKVAVLFNDITERKRAEESLRASEAE